MKSIDHTGSFEIDVPVAALFPLFSPEGEKQWVPGWDYQNVMGTTELSEDYIFLTKNHDHGVTQAIWIVKKYDPGFHLVQYYKIEPDEKIGVVTVKCAETAAGRTQVWVNYKYTALSASGERFISGFTQNAHREFVAEWKRLLLNYFSPGERGEH